MMAPDDPDERPDSTDLIDATTHRPRRCVEMCATCIYRPGNPMDLQPGRLRHITQAALQSEAFIVCHETAGNTGVASAVCRGFADRYSTNLLRILDRLGPGFHDVDPAAEKGPQT
jgi:hypothetical protein